MRNFIVGLIVGVTLGSSLAWAAASIRIVDNNNKLLGTTANPLYVTTP